MGYQITLFLFWLGLMASWQLSGMVFDVHALTTVLKSPAGPVDHVLCAGPGYESLRFSVFVGLPFLLSSIFASMEGSLAKRVVPCLCMAMAVPFLMDVPWVVGSAKGGCDGYLPTLETLAGGALVSSGLAAFSWWSGFLNGATRLSKTVLVTAPWIAVSMAMAVGGWEASGWQAFALTMLWCSPVLSMKNAGWVERSAALTAAGVLVATAALSQYAWVQSASSGPVLLGFFVLWSMGKRPAGVSGKIIHAGLLLSLAFVAAIPAMKLLELLVF